MFLKPKPIKPIPLEDRITRPVYYKMQDTVEYDESGKSFICQKKSDLVPEEFPDLGNADCYGIAYQQSMGVDLSKTKVDSPTRVTPIEAIIQAEKFINSVHVSENEN